MRLHTLNLGLLAAVLTVFPLSAAHGTELVYAPVNPTFGGNPNNGPMLLNDAQAQNHFKAPVNSPLTNFNNNLQSAILSRLLSESTSRVFGTGNVLAVGHYDTGAYTVDVSSGDGVNMTIVTTDKASGATVTFTVGPNGVSSQ